MNRIFSVALIYCDKLSTIVLGAKEEIKNILESGGFFKGVQQYFQRKFPHKTYHNFKEKCSQILPSQRPSTLFIEAVKQLLFLGHRS